MCDRKRTNARDRASKTVRAPSVCVCVRERERERERRKERTNLLHWVCWAHRPQRPWSARRWDGRVDAWRPAWDAACPATTTARPCCRTCVLHSQPASPEKMTKSDGIRHVGANRQSSPLADTVSFLEPQGVIKKTKLQIQWKLHRFPFYVFARNVKGGKVHVTREKERKWHGSQENQATMCAWCATSI